VSEPDIQTLVEDYYDRLFRAARFMSGSSEVAEDLVQDSFLAAAKSLHRFEGRSSPYTWLYGILRNKFRTWLRKKDDKVVSINVLRGGAQEEGTIGMDTWEDEARTRPEEELDYEETVRFVRESLDELSEDHRTILAMRYVDEMSYQEIAEVVDCPIGTVKSRIHYALGKMSELLQERGVEGRPDKML
jgi:RNA polymerase sigma-70 factor (ECF subfamily)